MTEFYRRPRRACYLHHQGIRRKTLVNIYKITRREGPEDSHLRKLSQPSKNLSEPVTGEFSVTGSLDATSTTSTQRAPAARPLS